MTEYLLRLKFEVRSLLAREPALAPLQRLVIWWTQHKMRGIIDVRECRVGPETEFVLDGFQGSGNSFATVAFKQSQQRPVLLAHHLHSPAQIIEGVRKGLPTLMTIRDPEDAVVSLVSRWPYVTLCQALRSYARFYEKVEPYADGIVLSPFQQTTRHLGAVIEAVNQRFGTDFVPFDGTEESVRSVRGPKKLASEEEVERQAFKELKRRELESIECQALRERARAVYKRLKARSFRHHAVTP